MARIKKSQPLAVSPTTPTEPPFAPLPLDDLQRTYGVSGLTRFGGYIYEEFLPQLQGQRGQKILREMRDNDPTIGAMLYLLEQLIKQADWDLHPFGGKAATVQDVALQEFVRGALFDDMVKTWSETLSEIASMFWAGFAPMEVTYKRRQGEETGVGGDGLSLPASHFTDGRLGWDQWAVRAQETVWRWQFDARNDWQAVVQLAPPDYRIRIIPREKVLLFRVKSDRDNPEGRSLIRNCYAPWFASKKLKIIEAIGIERKLAGFPVLIPPTGVDLWNPNDATAVARLAQAEKFVRNVRMDEQMGAVLPNGWDFKLIAGDSGRQTTDTNTVINRYEHRMAMTIAMDFIFLGSGGSGGARAQAGIDVRLFNTALQAVLVTVSDIINRRAIPKLLQYNGLPTDRPPRLVHGSLDTPDLTEMGAYVTALAGAGMALFPNPDLEAALLSMGGLPTPTGGIGKRERARLRKLRDQTGQLEVPRRLAGRDKATFAEAVATLRTAFTRGMAS